MSKSAYFISVSTGIASQAEVNKTQGEYSINTKPQPFFEAGLNYQKQITKSFCFVAGLRGFGTGRNIIFNVPINKFHPSYRDPFPPFKHNQVDFGLAVPIYIEKLFEITTSEHVFILAGLNFRYAIGPDWDNVRMMLWDRNYQEIEVFSLLLNANNDKKPWINYQVGGGYGFVLKNLCILKLGLSANFSSTEFTSGIYRINIPSQLLSEGTYSVTGSNFGILASYVFTNTRKKRAAKHR